MQPQTIEDSTRPHGLSLSTKPLFIDKQSSPEIIKHFGLLSFPAVSFWLQFYHYVILWFLDR